MANTADIAIVGGGIAGLSLAVELKRRKAGHVVVIERNYIGSGASARNVGRIRAMQLTDTLTRYALLCQQKYDQMAEALGYNVLFWRAGYLWLLYDLDEVTGMGTIVQMHHRLGVQSELLKPEDVYRLVPQLRGGDQITGGVAHDADAIVHHDAVVWAYYETARKLGVEIRQHTEVVGFNIQNAQMHGIELRADSISAPYVINAAGAWSSRIAAMAGITIPNRPIRREVMVTAPVKPFLSHAITFYRPTEGWFNQTLRGEVVAGVVDPQEPYGVNSASSFDFLTRTASMIVKKMPAFAGLTVIRQWAGMYDITPDHQPLIGESNQLRGFYQANGWSGRGMLLSPLSMQLLAEGILTGIMPQALPKEFNPNRFEEGGSFEEEKQDYYQRYLKK